jgi:ornithine cyclodeaminase/alanine dehydrogenase-like protein (mu-crystallin family)
MRTGVMDALILRHTHHNLGDLRILLFGSGKTATWAIKGLAALTPEIRQVDYYSPSGRKEAFELMGQELGIELKHVSNWKSELQNYDIVTCHTRAEAPFLIEEDIPHIKPGAQIHSFITSTEHGELADAFYTKEINLVSDWPKILGYNKILMRAVENKQIKSAEITYLREIFGHKYTPKPEVPYTIYQFGGTPIQNLAVLQLLTR